MDRSKKPKINPSYKTEEFDDELLIYSESNEKAFYMNDTAQVILKLCDDDLTVDQIITYLQEKYPDNQSEVEDDVIDVLTSLESNGIITLLYA